MPLSLHAAITNRQARQAGLRVEPLFEEELILVVTEAAVEDPPMGPNYVYVDWGSEFRARHSTSFPDFTGPGLTANIGWLGLQHILACGGSGYFPRRVVAKHLTTGQLHEVPGTPAFTLPAYLVYPTEHDPVIFDLALMQLRKIAADVAAS